MQQVLVIHGGTTFDSQEEYLQFIRTRELTLDRLRHGGHDWRFTLQRDLGNDYDVFLPKMPNGTYAKYDEWVIWFERCVALLDDGLILVGHSLGGIFLAKYLAERDLLPEAKATFLVAAPFNDVSTEEKLTEFALPASLDLMTEQAGMMFVVHSEDDPVVPFGEVAKYQVALPSAKTMLFTDRGHFSQREFSELVEKIVEVSN